MKMSVSFLISYIAVSAFFFSIDNIANMCYSIDSSSSEESIDSIRQQMDNGLQFAPRCVGQCFLQQAECDHTIQNATLNHVGNYVVFPSMWYHNMGIPESVWGSPNQNGYARLKNPRTDSRIPEWDPQTKTGMPESSFQNGDPQPKMGMLIWGSSNQNGDP